MNRFSECPPSLIERHLGMIIGSRAFMDGWFGANQVIVKGRNRTERKRGAKPLGKAALRGLYAFRDVK